MKPETGATRRSEAPQAGGTRSALSIAIGRDGVVIGNAVIEGAQPERYALEELQTAAEIWIFAIQRATSV